MKKNKVLTIIMALLIVFTAVGCAPGGPGPGPDLDGDKSTLYIANFDGGAGENWLEPMARAFEERFAEESFEEGKKGVQVEFYSDKSFIGNEISSGMPGAEYSIYFAEQINYYDLIDLNVIADMTSVITSSLSDVSDTETGTIQDKLYGGKKAWVNAGTENNPKYYGLPHYSSPSGIFYNKTLFKEKSLYISKDGGYTNDPTKFTVGPDGVSGTYDDGMPSSFEEFFDLCDHMLYDGPGVTPFTWTGKPSYQHYFNHLGVAALQSMLTKEELGAYFTFSGPVEVYDATTGNTTKETITPDSGYKTRSSYAMYKTLDFASRIFSNPDYYTISTLDDHLAAQYEYIVSSYENNDIAFLVEGSYWYNEAVINDSFTFWAEEYAGGDTDVTLRDDFGFVRIPYLLEGAVEEGEGMPLSFDVSGSSMCLINANVNNDPAKKRMAELFVKFCYTDEWLQKFTTTTGLVKGVEYELTAAQKEEMETSHTFGLEIVEVIERAEKVYPTIDCTIYNKKSAKFGLGVLKLFPWSLYSNNLSTAFKAGKTAKDYFNKVQISAVDWANECAGI